ERAAIDRNGDGVFDDRPVDNARDLAFATKSLDLLPMDGPWFGHQNQFICHEMMTPTSRKNGIAVVDRVDRHRRCNRMPRGTQSQMVPQDPASAGSCLYRVVSAVGRVASRRSRKAVSIVRTCSIPARMSAPQDGGKRGSLTVAFGRAAATARV